MHQYCAFWQIYSFYCINVNSLFTVQYMPNIHYVRNLQMYSVCVLNNFIQFNSRIILET